MSEIAVPTSASASLSVLTEADLAPWGWRYIRTLVVLNAVAVGLLIAGWVMASGQVDVVDQMWPLNIGAAGVIVSGLANAAWLFAGRRSVAHRRVGLEYRCQEFAEASLQRRGYTKDELGQRPLYQRVVVVHASVSHHHIRSCPLVAGKPVFVLNRRDPAQEHLTACEICKP